MRAKVLLLLASMAFLSSCGGSTKTVTTTVKSAPPALGQTKTTEAETEDAAVDLGFPGFATRNTTRVGGADPVADAAGVAQAVYPGQAEDSKPDVVTIVDAADFAAAVSAGQLMHRPLQSPVLYSQDGKLPAATEDALEALDPLGAEKAGKAQVLRVGSDAAKPEDLKVADIPGADPASIGRAVDRIATSAAGKASRAVIVASPAKPDFAMPAAGLSAKTGAPVLWVDGDDVPQPTVDAIKERKQPRIYVIGPEAAVSKKAFEKLGKLGDTARIAGDDPVLNAIAVARYADGAFGWNVVDPGHGLVFVSEDRVGDAAAAVALSGSGTYAPLLLVSDGEKLDKPVENYLLDIQPGFDLDPVRGVYNHGWFMGGADAISVPVQARIDSLLEIAPVSGE
jgi:putative cell wall-binding protein